MLKFMVRMMVRRKAKGLEQPRPAHWAAATEAGPLTQETVKSPCYQQLERYVLYARPDKVNELYRDLPAPFDGWDARARLNHSHTVTSLAVWKKFMGNFESIIGTPDALMLAGRFIAHPRFDWGPLRGLKHTVVRTGDPELVVLLSMIGGEEYNSNKTGVPLTVLQRDNWGSARVQWVYKHADPKDPHQATWAEADLDSWEFILGNYQAMLMMFGEAPARCRFLQFQHGILPHLAYYQRRCKLYRTVTQIAQFSLVNGTLWINGEVYGKEEVVAGRSVVRILRDLDFYGEDLKVLRTGQLFGAPCTEMAVEYTYTARPIFYKVVDFGQDLLYLVRGIFDKNAMVPARWAFVQAIQVLQAGEKERDEQLLQLRQQLMLMDKEAHQEELYRLADMVECKDQLTAGHCFRVGRGSRWVAEGFNLEAAEKGEQPVFSSAMLDGIEEGGRLHDLGKIRIPDEILGAPRRLTPEERAIMEEHPDIGYEMARDAGFGYVCLHCIRWHHRRFDGTGYGTAEDRGQTVSLVGEELPLYVQIVSAFDVYDALSRKRQYKGEKSLDEVEEMMYREFVETGHLSKRSVDMLFKVLRGAFGRPSLRVIEDAEIEEQRKKEEALGRQTAA